VQFVQEDQGADVDQDLAHPDLPDSPDLPADMTPDLPGDMTPDLPEDMTPDLPEDMAPDLPEDMTPDLPQDMTPDLEPDIPPPTCVTAGCTEPQVCDLVTETCGPCKENAPCSQGRICDLNAGLCVCPMGQNYCNGQCVAESAQACGSACSVCSSGFQADPICDQGVCGLQCQNQDHVIYKNGCLTAGGTCPSASQPLAGTCDPIYQSGCSSGFLCTFALRFGNSCMSNLNCLDGQICSNGTCVYFESGCSPDTDATLPIGSSCVGTTSKCVPGGLCSIGVCKQICDPLTGAGCPSSQVCRPIQAGSGAGLCESAC